MEGLTKHLDPAQRDKIVDYVVNGIRGKCISPYCNLDIRRIPWDRIKRENIAGFELVKSSHTRRVIKMTFTPEGALEPVNLYAKRMRIRRGRQRIGSLFARSKGRREWRMGHRIRAVGIDTPLPVLYAEERKGLWLRASYVVLTAAEGKCSALALLNKIESAGVRAKILKTSAQFMALVHQKGIYHDDFSSEHIFLPEEGNAYTPEQGTLIDLDNSTLSHTPPGMWKRSKNLFQFLRSVPSLTRREKLRFLVGYYKAGAIKQSAIRRYIFMINVIARIKGEAKIF